MLLDFIPSFAQTLYEKFNWYCSQKTVSFALCENERVKTMENALKTQQLFFNEVFIVGEGNYDERKKTVIWMHCMEYGFLAVKKPSLLVWGGCLFSVFGRFLSFFKKYFN